MIFRFNPDAEYIWKAQNGVNYVNKELKIKKTVTTKCRLQRIPHNNRENDTMALKIGRYRNNGTLENDNPKSELTLDHEELAALLEFLDTFIQPMKAGVSSFIPLGGDGGHLSELVSKFKRFAASDQEKAKALLEGGLLNSNFSSSLEHLKRVDSLSGFKQSLEQNYDESFWQTWFENNKWMLGSEFAKIFDQRRIDIDHIADFIAKSNDGYVDIVEIKKPNGMAFWNLALDHNNYVPSSDLVKAITQCQNYIFEIERESNCIKFGENVENTPIASPRCLLVFGRSKDWNDKQFLSFRLLNASLSRINVITYDLLYERASIMLGLENGVKTKGNE